MILIELYNEVYIESKMISEKMYETTLNIDHPCKFIASEANAKRQVKDTFEGKCYYGSLILEVVSIDKTSMCRLITSNHNATGIVNVCFTARVINYRKGDIIVDAKIEIASGQVVATSKYAVITIIKSLNNKILTNGQTIPVRVEDRVLYNVNSNSINVEASILTPQIEAPIYHVVGTLDSKIYNTVSMLVDRIVQQEEELSTEESKKFATLMNPKQVRGGASKMDKCVNIINLLNKVKTKSMDIDTYLQKDITSTISLSVSSDENPPTNGEYIETTTVIAIQELLYNIYALREGIIDMGKYYDKEKSEQSSNIWALMKKSKLS